MEVKIFNPRKPTSNIPSMFEIFERSSVIWEKT